MDFLEATQSVEREVQHRFSRGEVGEDAGTLSNHMWLTQKFVDIIATSPAVRTATFNFARQLNDALWNEMPADRDFQKYVGTQRYEFLQAARKELEAPKATGRLSVAGLRE